MNNILRIMESYGIIKSAHSVLSPKEDPSMEIERKLYRELLSWKRETQGKKALLIEGARRVGKSTIAEKFGREQYRSYILIDFITPAIKYPQTI